jgi:hypothetical protein
MENRTTRMLNVAMLFSVSLVPYLFNLVTLYGDTNETIIVEYVSVFFAADMAALVVILAFFIHELAVEEKQLITVELMGPYKRVRNLMVLSALLFLITTAPQFWQLEIQNVPLRFYLWLIPIALFWIGRLPEEPNKLGSPIRDQNS